MQNILVQEGLADVVENFDRQIGGVAGKSSRRIADNTLFDPKLTRTQEKR